MHVILMDIWMTWVYVHDAYYYYMNHWLIKGCKRWHYLTLLPTNDAHMRHENPQAQNNLYGGFNTRR